MKLLVISPTWNPQLAEKMIATARRVGIEPMLYGLNSNHPHGKDYQGTDIVDILKERKDVEYVMGVDAPDIAFVGGEDEILQKLNFFQYPFVVSGELDGVRGIDRLQEELFRQCQAEGGVMPQLNIGAWVGKRTYTLACFEVAERMYKDRPENPDYNYDNHFQYLAMMKAWGGMPFHIDTKCEIFQSTNKADTTFDTNSKRVINMVTHTWPSVIHFNGDPTRGAYNKFVEEVLR